MFTNVRSVLSQRNTRLKLLYLLIIRIGERSLFKSCIYLKHGESSIKLKVAFLIPRLNYPMYTKEGEKYNVTFSRLLHIPLIFLTL